MARWLFVILVFQSYHAMAETGWEDQAIGLSGKECRYFFEVGLENNSIDYKELDIGYTHGNVIALHEKCDSGEDTAFKLESKMFIDGSWVDIGGKYTFTEENRAVIEKNDWRNFARKAYFSHGLLIGLLSNKNRFLAGKQVEWYHDIFQSDIIPAYNFYARDREEAFIGIPLGIGKALSLDKSNTVCPC